MCLTALRTVSQGSVQLPLLGPICPTLLLGRELVRLSHLSTFSNAPPSAWNFSPTSELVLSLIPQDWACYYFLGCLIWASMFVLGTSSKCSTTVIASVTPARLQTPSEY